MENCWASYRGDCCEKLSREHLVSKSLFESDAILVQGFSWCKDEKLIGIQSLVTKNLCSYHNSALSNVDEEGAKAWNTIKEVNRIENQRKKMGARRWNLKKHQINGQLLERWFLKTIINLSWNQPLKVGLIENGSTSGNICPRLKKAAFGENGFVGKSGLYMVAQVGQDIDSREEVSFTPLIKDKEYILGGLFLFRGFKFFLALTSPPNSEKPFDGLAGLDSEWQNSSIFYHLEKIRFKNQGKVSQKIIFNW